MSNIFQELTTQQLNHALEELLVPKLKQILQKRDLGHCMRLADLDLELMILIAQKLRQEITNAQVFILSNQTSENNHLYLSSTKLVELRNPLADGSLRPPLLILIPANLHTNAEDSFNIATFEEIDITNIYEQLTQILIQQLPPTLQGYLKEIFTLLNQEKWSWSNAVTQVRFLLTAIANGNDGETVGAALYELGLIPDFQLFDDTSRTLIKIKKNLQSVAKITTSDTSVRGRIIELGIAQLSIQNQLIKLLLELGIETPQKWTRVITLNKNYWNLSFDKWHFTEDLDLDQIQIEVSYIDLPEIEEDVSEEKLQNLVGTQVLNPQERKKLQVEFTVEPHPSQVQGLDYFTVQIISQNSGAVGTAKKVKVWKNKSNQKKVNLDQLNKIEFEEGWHYLKILPWTKEGNPIPLRDNLKTIGSKNDYESDLFYVISDIELDEEPPQRAIPKEHSLEHALLQLQLTAINNYRDANKIKPQEVIWSSSNHKTAKIAEESLEIKFGREGKRQIPVPKFLKELEQNILASAVDQTNWILPIIRGQVQTLKVDESQWQNQDLIKDFLTIRQQYFSTISQGKKKLISQAIDFRTKEDIIYEYAQSYLNLLENLQLLIFKSEGKNFSAFCDLKKALSIDSIKINLTDFQGITKEALLLSPTHPLRSLWFLNWAILGQEWIELLQQQGQELIMTAKDHLLKGLVPLNFPIAFPVENSRIFIGVDNIHPFWSLYASSKELDPRGLLGDICSALDVPEPNSSGSNITGELLANRLERYLLQHPYISTLTINVFNPGRATLLTKTLTELQRNPLFNYLKYQIRLFVANTEITGVGEALQQLLSTSNNNQTDSFSSATTNHLFPQFNVAIHSINDFRVKPENYEAHIAILMDLFPPKEIGVAVSFSQKQPEQKVPLYGLIQDFMIKFHDDLEGTFWQRQPLHGKAIPLTNHERLTELLVKLPQTISESVSTIAIGEPAKGRIPVITLGLKATDRQLLSYIHSFCDWVFIIDRNIGIEFFDHGGNRERPPYLVDYTPDASASFGHHLVITSRSLSELESILEKLLEYYGLEAQPNYLTNILDNLRSLSGRLALKLLSTPQQQAEVLGLALARQFLQYQGALSNQIIVPLDAHLELFRTLKSNGNDHSTINVQRTDLALFNLDVETRTILCNLVEVKCYTDVGGIGDFNRLKGKISQQLQESKQVLEQHFSYQEKPNTLLKLREFATLLNFYLERSLRYELIDEDTYQSAKRLIATLENGYELKFTYSGLIFDFEKTGTDAPESENGVEYYRIGIDLIKDLISMTQRTETNQSKALSTETTIPKLDSASFLVTSKTQNNYLTTTTKTLQESQNLYDVNKTNEWAKPPELTHKHTQNSFEQLSDNINTQNDQDIEQLPNLDQQNNLKNIPSKNNENIAEKITENRLKYDILLGSHSPSPQYGIIGEISNRKIALDLNQPLTISLFGVQGAGKSYTLGSIIEMACLAIPNINQLPSPLATVIFHYSPTQDYQPEFTSMNQPNNEANQLKLLEDRYGAKPASLKDIMILTSAAKVAIRKAEFPDLEIKPITFSASELSAVHWNFLMGAVGNQSMYVKQLNTVMRTLGKENLTIKNLQEAITSSYLSDNLKSLALTRLNFASEYISEQQKMKQLIRPGRLIIVDIRDEYILKDEALGLFVVLLQIFSEARYQEKSFNKLIVFDEAHQYMENQDLIAGLIEIVRVMRHKGTSILVASQDPPSVPLSLIELSSQIILHRFNSPAWLKHIQKANAALNNLTPELMSQLAPGEAYIWSAKSTDSQLAFTKEAIKIQCRPRITQHGGSTKTAVKTVD